MARRVVHPRGSFSDFYFHRGLRINLCDALYSEKLEWRYLTHDEVKNDHNCIEYQQLEARYTRFKSA